MKKQRWEEPEKRREERRSENLRRRKSQVIAKSRNIAFFQ